MDQIIPELPPIPPKKFPKKSRFFSRALIVGAVALGLTLVAYIWEDSRALADEGYSALYQEPPQQETAQEYLELGQRYEEGEGVEQNYHKAMQCYLKAEEMGSSDAQVALGNLYCDGKGVSQDLEFANYYYHLAAIHGNAEALYFRGLFMEFGYGVPQNLDDAFNYYHAASQQQQPFANYRLALFYCAGVGTEQSYDKALFHLNIAAEQGVPDAYYVLGLMHQEGHGLERSEEQALAYFTQAESLGFEDWDGAHLFLPREEEEGEQELSYAERIEQSAMPVSAKRKARQRLQEREQGGASGVTAGKWLDGALQIPFAQYTQPPVTLEHPREEISAYMESVKQQLDQAVYGQEDAKAMLMRVVGQGVANGGAHGEVIGIQGPPGVGKTALVKQGIAEALGRPFVFISLSGARDGSYLKGSDMVFIGSEWGAVSQGLMDAQVMNPVIFFDEVDKVGQHAYGAELANTLIALTDRTQNDRFQDTYFRGIDLDLSKALIIFSFNDLSAIDPVLRDRMILIEAEAISSKDKVVIAKDYLMPEILEETGFREGDISFSDTDLRWIIKNYSPEAGVRRLREKLLTVVRDINLKRLENENFQLPYQVSRETIEKSLGEARPDDQKILAKPTVGVVTGLYATAAEEGGITLFQVSKKHSGELLSLELTGSQGDTMRESMAAARTVAWNLLSSQEQARLQNSDPFGLHIHAMSSTAAIPKDGPSGGVAISLAIVSALRDKAIRHDVAITGEVDLQGKAVAVGGISAKIRGAKSAGAKQVILPKDNQSDVEKLRKKDPEALEGITVHFIETVDEALPLVFR